MASRYSQQMARLRAAEARHTGAVRIGLIRQGEEAVAALLQLPSLPDAAGVEFLAARLTSRWLLLPLENLYVRCGSREARDTYAYLTRGQKAEAPPAVVSGWGQRLRRFISTEGAAAVRGITETTRRVVRQALNESVAAGEGIATAAARLRARVAELAPQRARRIVRTELITAANQGSLLGAEATGLQLDKFWIATPGARTRPSHAAANKQTVRMSESFTVGGLLARYPGDPLLSAKERCNCRCAIGYKLR